MLTDLFYRLRALVRGRAVERELEEELRFHLEHEIDKHVASGRSCCETEDSACRGEWRREAGSPA